MHAKPPAIYPQSCHLPSIMHLALCPRPSNPNPGRIYNLDPGPSPPLSQELVLRQEHAAVCTQISQAKAMPPNLPFFPLVSIVDPHPNSHRDTDTYSDTDPCPDPDPYTDPTAFLLPCC